MRVHPQRDRCIAMPELLAHINVDWRLRSAGRSSRIGKLCNNTFRISMLANDSFRCREYKIVRHLRQGSTRLYNNAKNSRRSRRGISLALTSPRTVVRSGAPLISNAFDR
jgi:hypothetical protein